MRYISQNLVQEVEFHAESDLPQTVLSPVLTTLGGLMFAQGRAMLNGGFAIWKSCTEVALKFVQKIEANLSVNFNKMQSALIPMDGTDRLKYLYSFWHMGEGRRTRSRSGTGTAGSCICRRKMACRVGSTRRS